ncbi:lipoyl synthase [Desulfovibrio aerotolerans]|uniref:Lipoyl synthase n=1 Tax=Solidesulfovibrio aerotolerans TaxID=295255 RepID=A0A7C9IP37_9BACT|nr:lipoyl synthase [Solidesulfovibrio aerotolerans]MYL84766.1 lipoyl synthase [Solidesulfovibrio aerotolerans]
MSNEPSSPRSNASFARKPSWLRRPLPQGPAFTRTQSLLRDLRCNTVCDGANCPNRMECYQRGVAAFLILGRVCTRNCAFCKISPGAPEPVDPQEPDRVAQAAARLGLGHVVVTSVSRDDLPDGGAGHFAAVLGALRRTLAASTLEVLIPDFGGDAASLQTVLDARPDVLNHNLETVPELYAAIRPRAVYARSLALLERAKKNAAPGLTKSGLMLGLGETPQQIRRVLADLAAVGCDIVTIGQYLAPSARHAPIDRYVTPEEFDAWAAYGATLGIPRMHCAPLVRSSYNAGLFV